VEEVEISLGVLLNGRERSLVAKKEQEI